MLRKLLLNLIGLYKRHLSPRKGFSCAYRANTGKASCSTLGFRAIRRFGAVNGMGVLRKRMALCHSHAQQQVLSHTRPHRKQRGDCDCALPDIDVIELFGDCCFDLSLPNKSSKPGRRRNH